MYTIIIGEQHHIITFKFVKGSRINIDYNDIVGSYIRTHPNINLDDCDANILIDLIRWINNNR